MRNLVFLAIIIILMGFGYIGFSMVTFEPENVRRFNVEALNDHDQKDISEDQKLSISAEKKKKSIISLMKQLVLQYDSQWDTTPLQVENLSFSLLNAIKSGRLPMLYPLTDFSTYQQSENDHSYEILGLVSESISQVSETADNNTTSYAGCPTGSEGFILGDTGKNKLSCTKDTKDKVRVYLGGPDNDYINAKGNSIINGGSGNDNIEAGPEFTMIFVEPNFGTDNINIDCSMSKAEIKDEKENILPWKHQFVHFVVFDSRISKTDINETNDYLEHKTTGDRISFNDDCFNIVYLSEE